MGQALTYYGTVLIFSIIIDLAALVICNQQLLEYVQVLPTVDLSASNPTAIYSVLQYICKKAAKLNIETPCITFDQPLYIKAFEKSKSLQMNIVIRLSGFHLLMSFLGSIGNVMEGSGLKDGLESIYAPVTVGHMLTDKAFSRALRRHFLAESAIFALILSNAIPEEFITASFQTDNQNRMHDINETKNETESRMNETENNQREESESTNEGPFNLVREESQESKKCPNCLTKSDLQELEVLYNNPEELENDKIPDVIEKLSSTISEL